MIRLGERFILGALIACLVAAVPVAARNLWPRPAEYDFEAFYLSARAVAAGRSPYAVPALDSTAGEARCCATVTRYVAYPYPPWHAGLLSALARLPFETAAWIWYVLNVLLLALSVRLVAAETSLSWSWRNLAVLGSLFPYADYTLRLGQMSPLILAAVLLGARMARDARARTDAIGGALVGFAGALKIFPLLCAFPFVARRRWVASLGVTAGLALAIGAGSLPSSARTSLGDWVHRVAPAAAAGASGVPQQQSIQATAIRLLTSVRVLPARGDSVTSRPLLTAPRAGRIAGQALAAVVALIALGVVMRRAARERTPDLSLEIALMLATLTLAVTIAWDHYFVFLLPAEAALLARWRDPASRWLLLAGALLLALHRFWRVLAFAQTAVLLSLGTAGATLIWLGIARALLDPDGAVRARRA